MLRITGFLTGCGLTALLAMAMLEPAARDVLRRSATTLVAGEEPAAVGAAEEAGPTPVGLPAVVPPGEEAGEAIEAESAVPAAPAVGHPAGAGFPLAARSTGTAAGPDGAAPSAVAEASRRDGPGGETGPGETGQPLAPRDGAPDDGWPDVPGPGAGETASGAGSGTAVEWTDGADPPSVSGAWHAFWTPFHSEASAAGFARHLEQLTGVPHRVVRTGPAAYGVVFWHDGEDARDRRLMAIERASGLRLGGGEL